MNANEAQPQYAHSLRECLSSYDRLPNIYVGSNVVPVLDAGYETALASAQEKLTDALLAATAASAIVEKEGLSTLAILLRMSQDEQPVDERLSAWKDFGPFEKQVRDAVIDKLLQNNTNIRLRMYSEFRMPMANIEFSGQPGKYLSLAEEDRIYESGIAYNERLIEKINLTVSAPSGESK